MAQAFVASAARTINGNSGPIAIGSGVSTVGLELLVTAASGTLTVSIQWSLDGINFGSNDASADAFAAVTGTGNVYKTVSARGPYMQLSWTVSAGGSFTFSVLGVTSNVI